MNNGKPTYYALDDNDFLIRELGQYDVNIVSEANELTKEQDGDWLAMKADLQHFRAAIGTDNLSQRTFALETSELTLTEINEEDSENHDLVYSGKDIDEALKRHGF